ncbi:MAG: prepilin-type N-terminal cleavage/methylation domain-containing protein [Dehalococcoidales bacterium]
MHNGENQKGFTLIELIIAIAITSVVLAAATGTVYQLLAGNSHNSNAMLATRNIQQAGHWISRDILMAYPKFIETNTADPVTDPDTTVAILTLYWFEFESYDPSPEGDITTIWHEVTYELTVNANGTNPLYRKHRVANSIDYDRHNDPGFEEDKEYKALEYDEESSQLIANYISFRNTEELSITNTSGVYQLVITAYVPGFRPVEEQKVFEINPRLG